MPCGAYRTIDYIKWNAVAKTRQVSGNGGIGSGPVGPHSYHIRLVKPVSNGCCFENKFLFTWQVKHQSAVTSTKTVFSDATYRAIAVSSNHSHSAALALDGVLGGVEKFADKQCGEPKNEGNLNRVLPKA